MDSPASTPHVLMFPLPSQGDLSPMLKLSELLCLANLHVTFINTTYSHQKMTRYTDIEARFARYQGFRFHVIPDGLPDDHPRSGGNWLQELLQGLKSNATPLLIELFSPGSNHESRVTCLIVDVSLSFANELAKEAGVPVITFVGTSACFLWAFLCIPKLLEAQEIPFTDDEDMDQLVMSVPGMTSFLRRRDLPSFCRGKNTSIEGLQSLAKLLKTREALPIILNTFKDLEGSILSHLRTHYPRIYSVGPLQTHLKYKLNEAQEDTTLNSSPSTSLWEVDRNCISWLDEKPEKSVVYISFGSLTNLQRHQFTEIWDGLVQSKKYFLWVIRPNMILGSDLNSPTPDELLEGTEGRGYIVSWAPQEEVLAHRAVGGFLTHSGWNSTLESIVAGVPMLCWPYFYDQQVNSRYVSEVWKIGLDMKDVCDRVVVAKMVTDLMDRRRHELEKSTVAMSGLAKRSIGEGGSSHCDLETLVEDIKAMSRKETR